MKILVFSDSHGDVETMCGVVNVEKPDMIIHLGDSIEDADELNAEYSDIPMIKVSGNTDTGSKTQHVEICGKYFMLTHGDTFNVDKGEMRNTNGISDMALHGFNNGANIILFGHSHEPYVNCRNGKWIMNPGRIGRISSKIIHATYGFLIIENGKIQWSFKEVEKRSTSS